MEFGKVWQTLTDCWPIKVVCSAFISSLTFLIGEMDAPFIALWLLVIFDTLTKWISVSRLTLAKQNLDDSIFYGFYLAWATGALNSRAMRVKFCTKIFAYFILIIVANLLAKIMPSITFFGTDISRLPGGFIYSFLAVTEAMSIAENLTEMGMDALKPLTIFFRKKRDEMTGNKEEPK